MGTSLGFAQSQSKGLQRVSRPRRKRRWMAPLGLLQHQTSALADHPPRTSTFMDVGKWEASWPHSGSTLKVKCCLASGMSSQNEANLLWDLPETKGNKSGHDSEPEYQTGSRFDLGCFFALFWVVFSFPSWLVKCCIPRMSSQHPQHHQQTEGLVTHVKKQQGVPRMMVKVRIQIRGINPCIFGAKTLKSSREGGGGGGGR